MNHLLSFPSNLLAEALELVGVICITIDLVDEVQYTVIYRKVGLPTEWAIMLGTVNNKLFKTVVDLVQKEYVSIDFALTLIQ